MTKSAASAILLALIGMTLLLPALERSDKGVLYRGQVAVLMYHHVHDEDTSSSTVSPELFESQLLHLRKLGYTFINLAEFERYMEGADVPDNAVFVTFDDGYESFYTHAYPILAKLDIPATHFIITDKHDDPGAHYPPFMSADQIRAITSDRPGFISAQCHTHSMHNDPETPHMTSRLVIDGVRETEDEYRARIAADTAVCIRTMQALGTEPVNALAYPYGVYDSLSSRLVGESGIRYAFTIVPEMARRSANPLQIPRINAGSPNISPEALHEKIKRRIELLAP